MIKEIRKLLKLGYSVHFDAPEWDGDDTLVKLIDNDGGLVDAVLLADAPQFLKEALEEAEEEERNKSPFEGKRLIIEILKVEDVISRWDETEVVVGEQGQVVFEDDELFGELDFQGYDFNGSAKALFEDGFVRLISEVD